VRQQLGDPRTVLDVGLATGDLLDVLGVDQHQLELALQDVANQLPVDPVDFMATWVTPSAASQSGRANRSRVTVQKVRTSWCGRPFSLRRRTQATAVSL
jgi:hypothetical protein